VKTIFLQDFNLRLSSKCIFCSIIIFFNLTAKFSCNKVDKIISKGITYFRFIEDYGVG